jgi:MFS family permease
VSEATATSPGGLRGRAATVVLGCAVCQFGLGFTYLFDTYLRDIVAEFGWSRASFSAAHASRLAVLAVASPLAGWAADRYGARVVLSAGVIILGLVGFAYGRIQELYQLWILSLAIGLVMAGLGDVAVAAAVSRWVDRGRGVALGLVYSGSNVGGMIAVLASAPIVEAQGWRASVLYIAGFGSLALLPFALWAVRDPRPGEGTVIASSQPLAGNAPASGLDLRAALRTRSFWLLAAALTIFYLYYLAVLDHLVAFLQDVGLSRNAASQAFAVTILLGVGSKLGIGFLADRIPAQRALLLNFAVLALGSMLLLLVPRPGVLPVFVFAHGFSVAAQNVSYPVAVAHCFGIGHMARIYGVLMLALMLGGLPGSILAGAVFDRLGSYRPIFALFAVLNLGAVALLTGLRREYVAQEEE